MGIYDRSIDTIFRKDATIDDIAKDISEISCAFTGLSLAIADAYFLKGGPFSMFFTCFIGCGIGDTAGYKAGKYVGRKIHDRRKRYLEG